MPTLARARRLALVAFVLLGVAFPACAQPPVGPPAPRLGALTPCGARAGATVEVSFSGADLEEPSALVFSHPGIKAEPIIPPPPPPPDPKKKPPAPPSPPTPISRFKVTIASNVPVGIHDARFVGKWGVSNPRAFVVGDLDEVLEKEPNNDVAEAQRVALGTTIHGLIANPVDVDYYIFPGKKGQRVLASCLTASIDSRAHPVVEIYDARGRLVAANRGYSQTDALADATLPDDGDYHVRVSEFTHTQGGPEHFYRLTISTAPWIDAVHPCVVEPGKQTQVTVWGRNLPGGKIDPDAFDGDRPLEKMTTTVNPPADAAGRLVFSGHTGPLSAALDGFELRLRNDTGSSNPFLVPLARAPVVTDNGANDTPETAQEIAPPCEIAGVIEKRRDRDWYVFTAKKGETWLIELQAERLGAPTLPFFFVKAATAKEEMKESEDNPDVLHRKFFSRTEDPAVFRFTAPADGKYQLLVGSRTGDTQAGPRHVYRLRIAAEQPDFRLVAMPASDNRPEAAIGMPGGQQCFTVFVLRQDGFAGDVDVTVEGLPAGVTAFPLVLGGAVREGHLVFNTAATAAAFVGEVKIKGTAAIKGAKVVREARPACIVWPVPPMQNIPTLSRLDRGLFLAVRDKAPWSATAKIDKAAIVQGDKATIKVAVSRIATDFKTPLAIQAEVTELPAGLTINNNQPINVAPGAAEGTLAVNVAPTVQPGTYTIALRASGQVPYARDPAGKMKQPNLVVLPVAPVNVTVIPKELAKLALSNPGPTLKVGASMPLVVKATRMYNYDGELKVELVLPPGAKGVKAATAVIPAGKDEAPLDLATEAGAAPGTLANLTVRATGNAYGAAITQEVKFNLNIVK